ncbi:MAG: hypothetical protein IKJ74_07065 [Clostridia bacterium]|nr:hypothetical protein [Clostridia bacterium]
MKKLFCVLLAVLMIVPMFAACGAKEEGTQVEVANVKVYRYNDNTATETTLIYEGPITATVAEGATLTVKDIVLGFDSAAVYDEDTSRFIKISSLSADTEWFWNYQVNGAPMGLAQEVQATDAIELIYEPLNKVTATETAA